MFALLIGNDCGFILEHIVCVGCTKTKLQSCGLLLHWVVGGVGGRGSNALESVLCNLTPI